MSRAICSLGHFQLALRAPECYQKRQKVACGAVFQGPNGHMGQNGHVAFHVRCEPPIQAVVAGRMAVDLARHLAPAAPVFYPLCGRSPEMQGFGGSTYRPSYRHPGVATCSLGKPGPILGSAATGTARSAVGGPFQTFLAEHRARATGVSL